MTVHLIMSGDPKRRTLCERLIQIYRTYLYVCHAIVYYESNPAIAFNEGTDDSICVNHPDYCDTDTMVYIAGDVYIGESELHRFVFDYLQDVVFATNYLDVSLKGQPNCAPSVWTCENGSPFVSGLFRTNGRIMAEIHMQESPSFCEDIFWEKALRYEGFTFLGVHVPCVHIDVHSAIPRIRDIRWALIAPERYKGKTLIGRLAEIAAWRLGIRDFKLDDLERVRDQGT